MANSLMRAISIYLVVSFAFVFFKPGYFFDEQGKAKPFGIGPKKIICPFYIVALLTGVFVYFINTFLTNTKLKQ